jgi:hypothetical protein
MPTSRLAQPLLMLPCAVLLAVTSPALATEGEPVECSMAGWSLDESSLGTAVRSEPRDDAPIVGRLPPLREASPSKEAAPPEGWRTQFDITGYLDGWFRIANAEGPGTHYGDPPPADYPPTYSGEGWIKATEVGAAFANTNMPEPHLHEEPYLGAPIIPASSSVAGSDGSLSIDGTLIRLHACVGNWGFATSRDWQRGWWRGICANQVTNCS